MLYIFAAAREKPVSWIWAIISSIFWAYASYFNFKLYVDTLLQFFFIITSFIGLYHWKYGSHRLRVLPITVMSPLQHTFIILPGLGLSFIFGYFFSSYTSAASTYLDAFTTVFSILNTYLLVKKKIENWIYWMVIDGLMIYLFFNRGAYFFSALYLVYVILSIDGYLRWRKSFKLNSNH